MTYIDADQIRRIITTEIDSRGLVTKSDLEAALSAVKRDAASDYDLQRTNAAMQIEQAARQDLERRLSRLESDVQAIDEKMGQVLANVTSLKASQDDHFDDVKMLRTEMQALATASETLLELSRQRQATTNHLLSTQEKHSQILNQLTDEGGERAEELVRLEASMTALQAAVVANQERLERIKVRIDSVDDVLTTLGAVVTMVTSKRSRAIITAGLALLFSAAFNVDVVGVVEAVLHLLAGP